MYLFMIHAVTAIQMKHKFEDIEVKENAPELLERFRRKSFKRKPSMNISQKVGRFSAASGADNLCTCMPFEMSKFLCFEHA